MRKEITFRDKFIKKKKKVNKSHTTDVTMVVKRTQVWWTQRAHTLVRERLQTYKITCVPWYVIFLADVFIAQEKEKQAVAAAPPRDSFILFYW